MTDTFDLTTTPWRLLDDLFGDLSPLGMAAPYRWRTGRYPRINAWEGDQGLVLEAEIPGVDPASVEVSVENTELVLKGKRAETVGATQEMAFERRFELPFPVDPETVQAKARNGVLTLTLPKAARARKRTIAIQAA